MVTTSVVCKARIRRGSAPNKAAQNTRVRMSSDRTSTATRESAAVSELTTVDELAGELMVADEMAP